LEILKIVQLLIEIVRCQRVFIEIAVVTRQNVPLVSVRTVFVSRRELFGFVIGTPDVLPQKHLLADMANDEVSVHHSKSQSLPVVDGKRKLLSVIYLLSNDTLQVANGTYLFGVGLFIYNLYFLFCLLANCNNCFLEQINC
jgi:hypothetical protein